MSPVQSAVRSASRVSPFRWNTWKYTITETSVPRCMKKNRAKRGIGRRPGAVVVTGGLLSRLVQSARLLGARFAAEMEPVSGDQSIDEVSQLPDARNEVQCGERREHRPERERARGTFHARDDAAVGQDEL